jgi:hypothetical protein
MRSSAAFEPRDAAPDLPLRLDVAARIAFPDGSMTASGLRKEAVRGRLTIWRVANKDYTSLAAIRDMMDKCRTEPKAHVSISETATGGRRFGKSVTDRTESALNALLLTVN